MYVSGFWGHRGDIAEVSSWLLLPFSFITLIAFQLQALLSQVIWNYYTHLCRVIVHVHFVDTFRGSDGHRRCLALSFSTAFPFRAHVLTQLNITVNVRTAQTVFYVDLRNV